MDFNEKIFGVKLLPRRLIAIHISCESGGNESFGTVKCLLF